MMTKHSVSGIGLGLRRDFLDEFISSPPEEVDFFEVAPENWMTLGGLLGEKFADAARLYPVVLHGLSLSLGGPEQLDKFLLQRIRHFMDHHQIAVYTEHLSYCSDQGHLYDLMPIPFTAKAIDHVVDRIKTVQDIIGDNFAIENVSYYAAPMQQMPEIDFLNQVLDRSGALLLLDVNNIYVNSINHQYDAENFLQQIPGDKICYCHIAGHYCEAKDLIVDTHGAEVIDPVWALLEKTYQLHGIRPTLLERDFNIPPLSELCRELLRIRQLMHDNRQQIYAA